jgi:hypothetical protein
MSELAETIARRWTMRRAELELHMDQLKIEQV